MGRNGRGTKITYEIHKIFILFFFVQKTMRSFAGMMKSTDVHCVMRESLCGRHWLQPGVPTRFTNPVYHSVYDLIKVNKCTCPDVLRFLQNHENLKCQRKDPDWLKRDRNELKNKYQNQGFRPTSGLFAGYEISAEDTCHDVGVIVRVCCWHLRVNQCSISYGRHIKKKQVTSYALQTEKQNKKKRNNFYLFQYAWYIWKWK